MTVLVSVVKQMIARGQADRRGGLRLDRRHLGRARGLLRRRGHPGGRAPAARTRSRPRSSSSRSPTARSCSRSTPTSTAAWPIVQEITKEKRIYLANSMNSLRIEGQKTVAHRDRPAVRLGGAGLDRDPGRQPRQRDRARQGLPHDARARARSQQLPRICVRPGRERQSALPLVSSRTSSSSSRSRPSTTLASAIQIGNPVSVERAIRALQRFDGVVEQASEQELADECGPRRPHRHVQLPAHRRRAGGAAQAGRAQGRSAPSERVVVISTAHGLKFADQKTAYHLGTLAGIQPTHRNRPVELPADAKQVAGPIARHVEQAAAGVVMDDRGTAIAVRPDADPPASRSASAPSRSTPASRARSRQRARHPDHADGDLHLRRHPGAARSLRAAIEREEYGRYGNPTQRIAEQKLAALEGAEDCLLFASGMAAVTTTLFAMLSRGAHVVVTDDSYRRTRQFLNQTLHRYGIECRRCRRATTTRSRRRSARPPACCSASRRPTRTTASLDLERFADIGRRHRVKTSSTRPSPRPYNQRPLEYGIDLVLHSATKYLGGHNDLLAGAVLGSAELVDGDSRAAGRDRRGRRSVRRLSAGPRAQDLRAPHRAAERQRPGRSPSSSRRTRGSSACTTPGLPSHPEHAIARAADARLRRRGVVRGRAATSTRRRRVVDALPHPAHRAVARRRREPDRAAGADELLRAHDRGAPRRSGSRTT